MRNLNNISILFIKSESGVLFPEIWDYISKFDEVYFDEKIPHGILWAGNEWIKFEENKLKINENKKIFILGRKENLEKVKKILKDKGSNFNEIKIEYRVQSRFFKKRFFCVVRPLPDALEFSHKVEHMGAKAIPLPLLKFKPIISSPLIEALEDKFDYIIFTSKRGILALKEILCPKKLHNFLKDKKIISIGPETAKELKKIGYFSYIPEEYSQEGILKFFEGLKNKSVLILRTEGRKLLNRKLKEKGYLVREIKVYEMIKEERERIELFSPFLRNITDFVFTSPKLFDTFLEFFNEEVLRDKNIIPIGRVTAEHIKRKGFDIKLIPKEFTGGGIIEAISKEVKYGGISSHKDEKAKEK